MENKEIRWSIAERIASHELPPYIYTYPPKGAYQPYLDWEQAARSWLSVEGPVAVYIHIPFCNMKCSFCSLFTVTNAVESIRERYVQALLLELKTMERYLQKDRLTVSSLYFGGGTPTLLSHGQLSRLMAAFQSSFNIDAKAEISIEGTPDTFDAAKIEGLAALGFNRISMGVQTFQPDHLKKMGRHYPPEIAYKAGKDAVASGIPNVNMDFIYGTPEQSLSQWQDNLKSVLEIKPATLTAYPLVVRQKTVYGRQKLKNFYSFADDKIKYEWYDITYQTLTANDYRQHTFVSFAREKGGCRHEENEFCGHPTLSFGAGARKYAPSLHYVDEDYVERLTTNKTMMEYMDAIESGRLLVKSAVQLDVQEQALRYVILSLLAGGIDQNYYERRFSEKIEDRFAPFLEALLVENLIECSNRRYALTQSGKKYSSIIGNVLASHDVAQLMRRYR